MLSAARKRVADKGNRMHGSLYLSIQLQLVGSALYWVTGVSFSYGIIAAVKAIICCRMLCQHSMVQHDSTSSVMFYIQQICVCIDLLSARAQCTLDMFAIFVFRLILINRIYLDLTVRYYVEQKCIKLYSTALLF